MFKLIMRVNALKAVSSTRTDDAALGVRYVIGQVAEGGGAGGGDHYRFTHVLGHDSR